MGVLHEMQDDGGGKFKKGYIMTRQQVKENFKNPNVQRAFTLIDYDTLSPELRAGCESLDEFFGKYSDYTESVMREREMITRERIESEVTQQVEIKLAQERAQIHKELMKEREEEAKKVQEEIKKLQEAEKVKIFEKMRSIARLMLDNHIPDDQILATTNLSPGELLKLKKKQQ
jgi:hypothetical protein